MALSKKLLLVMTTAALVTACSKPVKTVDYFHQHPEEISLEAKRCVENAGRKIDITKDKSCMNMIAVEREICMRQNSMMGNPFGISCDSDVDMIRLAYHGL